MAILTRRRYLPASAVSSSVARLQPFQDETFTYLFDIHSIYDREEFGGIIPFMIRQIRRLLKLLAILSMSIISYHLFYTVVMPSFSVAAPIYLDYTGAPAPSSLSSVESSHVNGNSLPTPWGSIDLFAKHHWDFVDTEDVVPTPLTSRRLLVSNRAYFMELVLVLPESDTNRASTGIFGVKVELASHNGTVLALSRRSARFPHQSRWISVLQKAVLLVPYLIGAIEESKHVVIPVFRHYVESRDYPLVSRHKVILHDRENQFFSCASHLNLLGKRHIRVQIVPRLAASTLVEITKAEIRMGKEFNTLQNILRDWYFTCYTFGTLIFMIVYAFIWTVSDALLEAKRNEGRNEPSEEEITTDNGSSASRRHESNGTEFPLHQEMDDDWDDVFYDAPTDANNFRR
jgi:hypothetical protein